MASLFVEYCNNFKPHGKVKEHENDPRFGKLFASKEVRRLNQLCIRCVGLSSDHGIFLRKISQAFCNVLCVSDSHSYKLLEMTLGVGTNYRPTKS